MIDVEQGPMIRRDPQIRRAPSGTGLYDVLDLILDKGLVIDAFVRVSLVGIELVTVDLRVVIASVDTYLRYAERAEQLQLYSRGGEKGLPEMVSGMKKAQIGSRVANLAERGEKTLEHAVTGRHRGQEQQEEDEGEEGQGEGVVGSIGRGVKHAVGRLVDTFTGGGEEERDKGEPERRGRDEPRHREREEPRHHRDRGNGHNKPAKAGSRR